MQILAGEAYSHRNLWIARVVKARKPLIAEGKGSVNLNKKQGQKACIRIMRREVFAGERELEIP